MAIGASGELAVLELTQASGEALVRARRSGCSVMYLRAAAYDRAALAVPGVAKWVDESRLRQRERECWARAVAGLGCTARVMIANPWLAVGSDAARAAWLAGDWPGFERELHLEELFESGSVARLLAVMRCHASPGEPTTSIVARVAVSSASAV